MEIYSANKKRSADRRLRNTVLRHLDNPLRVKIFLLKTIIEFLLGEGQKLTS